SNIQSLARKKRYELLFLKCKSLKISNLIIGHHLNDLIENFFIRMIRGSGLKGLVSLEKKTTIDEINLIRPLLEFEKKNLQYIAIQVFNFFIKDPSNENTNFTRIKVRKIINSFKDNGLENDKLFLTLKNLKGSDKVIQFYTEQNKRQNSYLDKENKKLFLNKLFFCQPYEVIFRSFSDLLKYIGGKYFSARGKKIDYILKLIEKGTLKKETLAGCVIKKVNQTVIIAKEY
ncbi:tRNA lysidine(34) synthetase TilS, partial [Candidatus Pelagibacter bacterium]|nr:tRNA lysidine(34) synthetase TilS [Candidatus Pelagibacter bacterium]